nr:PDZ domain-containing protein [uncultured Pedobacter sp.]
MKYILAFLVLLAISYSANAKDFYVSKVGNDAYIGSLNRPFATIYRAQEEARKFKNEAVNIYIREGSYYLSKPLVFTDADSRKDGASLIIMPYKNEQVVIKGSKKVDLKWELKKGIYQALVADQSLKFDELYVNGQLMQMARYPNYVKGKIPFGGASADAISVARVRKWKNPENAYLHAMVSSMWGGFSFLITGKENDSTLTMEGGWQNNRPSAIHKQYRFIENVFEELDTLNEWFFDKNQQLLYLKFSQNPSQLVVETPQLETLVDFSGNKNPVKNITLKGLKFSHTLRTFMKNREPLLRSDWTIYRKGAITLENAENIKIEKCELTDLGGNAVVFSCFNKNNTLSGSQIYNIGSSAVVFVGDPSAVRSPSFRYGDFVPYANLDKKSGPIGDNFPSNCLVYDNLIHDIGTVEKQTAGVQISMSQNIKVSHNTIYDVPRAGININEGTWGGHTISFNDVFNTVLETADHGAFNSWGRDRFWHPKRAIMDTLVAKHPELIFLDAIKPTLLYNNRFRCDNGWDIDLDDGSSNYIIKNNVCLSGGIKLREGFKRDVENNIIINNTIHPHVWFKNSGAIFKHNILGAAYLPIRVTDWGNGIDSNFFMNESSLKKVQLLNIDKHSLAGEPQFVNAELGDYRVKQNSKALGLGFENFEQNFGVVSPDLKAKAKKVTLPKILPVVWKADDTYDFGGVQVKNLTTLAERSATGMATETGVLVLNVSAKSLMFGRIKPNDVILEIAGIPIANIKNLVDAKLNLQARKAAPMKIFRDQKEQIITVNLK